MVSKIDLYGNLLVGWKTDLSNEENHSSVPSITARLLVECRCHLGKCVIWDDCQNAVLFTSILGRRFHKLILSDNNKNDKLESYELPKMLGAFGLLDVWEDNNNKHHTGYIVAWEDGFQPYGLEQGKMVGPMSQGETVSRSGLLNGLSDGHVDPTGKCFVCRGMATLSDLPLKVYKYKYDSSTQGLKHLVLCDKILVTNSICWSLSGEEFVSPRLSVQEHLETGV